MEGDGKECVCVGGGGGGGGGGWESEREKVGGGRERERERRETRDKRDGRRERACVYMKMFRCVTEDSTYQHGIVYQLSSAQ